MSGDMIDLEGRMERMEETLAFQEQTIEDLNEVVAVQGREISELTKQLALLAGRYRDLQGAMDSQGEAGGSEPPPPHYGPGR